MKNFPKGGHLQLGDSFFAATVSANWREYCNSYLFKGNNRNTRKRCKIYLLLTIKATERSQWSRSGAFIVNFEHISHFFLLFLLLTLNKQMLAGLIVFSNGFKSFLPGSCCITKNIKFKLCVAILLEKGLQMLRRIFIFI